MYIYIYMFVYTQREKEIETQNGGGEVGHSFTYIFQLYTTFIDPG